MLTTLYERHCQRPLLSKVIEKNFGSIETGPSPFLLSIWSGAAQRGDTFWRIVQYFEVVSFLFLSSPYYMCSSMTSPSWRMWSLFAIKPSCLPEPQIRAYFSLARKSLWTDAAASSKVLPLSRIIGSVRSGF